VRVLAPRGTVCTFLRAARALSKLWHEGENPRNRSTIRTFSRSHAELFGRRAPTTRAERPAQMLGQHHSGAVARPVVAHGPGARRVAAWRRR
jgi:hypothetical protein